MRQLDEREESLVIWGADDPLMIQLTAALRRMGKDAYPLVRTEAGLKQISPMNPKAKVGLVVPATASGIIFWAPRTELFFNRTLSEESLGELKRLLLESQLRVIIAAPHNARGQLDFAGTARVQILYFPALVGFGDAHFFDDLLARADQRKALAEIPNDEVLPVPDAVAYLLGASLLKDPLPATPAVWVVGKQINSDELAKGFAEAGKFPLPSLFSRWFKKNTPAWSFAPPAPGRPDTLPLASEVFATLATPWTRFFRDSWRQFRATPNGQVLLHFPPSSAP